MTCNTRRPVRQHPYSPALPVSAPARQPTRSSIYVVEGGMVLAIGTLAEVRAVMSGDGR